MGANPEASESIAIDELRALEASVLKALCLTVNTAGSELKYTILENVDDGDFFFPLNGALFRVLVDLHGRGEYVIASNLDEELRKAHGTIPANFVIDELFGGTIPGASDINQWIARMKDRASGGGASAENTPASPKVVAEDLSRTQSASTKASRAAAAKKTTDATKAAQTMPSTDFSFEEIPVDMSEVENPPSLPDVAAVRPASAPRKTGSAGPLSPEGDEWSSYMDEVAFTQGRVFETGFPKLDGGLRPLKPGLMLLVDHDRDRMFSFLKQVLDQVANGSDKRGLYLASELDKNALRLRTLARLGGVSAQDIEKGKLKKDSPEWARLEKEGREAASWLSRVFIQEMPAGFDAGIVTKLVRDVLAGGDETCLVVVDSVDRAAKGSDAAHVVSELKTLASELKVLVLAATTDTKLLASRDADLAAVFRGADNGRVEIEVLELGREDSTTVSFRYDPAVCGFIEE